MKGDDMDDSKINKGNKRNTSEEPDIETKPDKKPRMRTSEYRTLGAENRRIMPRRYGGGSTGRRQNYSMVRLRQTAINRLKTFKAGSDSVNDTIEELLNYYEANNQFLHTKLERFEEDLISGGRVRHFFPYSSDVDESELTITKLITFLRETFEDVTFVKYEYTTGEGIIGAPTYVITFYTEKRGIRRPFFMMMASVDNISGFVPHDPAEKNMAKGEAFFGYKPLFEASEIKFTLHEYITGRWEEESDQWPESETKEYIKESIKRAYELSRGQLLRY